MRNSVSNKLNQVLIGALILFFGLGWIMGYSNIWEIMKMCNLHIWIVILVVAVLLKKSISWCREIFDIF